MIERMMPSSAQEVKLKLDNMKGKKRLNLGCGNDCRQGYVNCDIYPYRGVDLFVDFNNLPFPFKENTFDEILCLKIGMYIKNFNEYMEELHRIAKPNAIIKMTGNYYNSQGSIKDPLHRRSFCLDSFDPYCDPDDPYHGSFKFKIINKSLKYTRLGNIVPFESLRRKLSVIFGEIASEVHIDLKAIK